MSGNADAIGVHSLDHFELTAPDLDEAERFYRCFGLDVVRDGATLSLRTLGSAHIWATLHSGAQKKLTRLSFGVYEQDFEAFARRLNSSSQSGVLQTQTPDGLPVELRVAAKTSLDAKNPFDIALPGPANRGASARSKVPLVKPRRLSHVTMFTADVQRSIDFYQDVLGLKLSDRSGNDVAFMHGRHGSDHHMVAVARSNGPGLHHSSWEVGTLSEVGQGAMQMADAGYRAGWGLGRHVLGSNYFYYVRDPWNSYCEYSADMDYIPATVSWPAGDHPGEDSFYQWGPPPPEDFVVNYEIVGR